MKLFNKQLLYIKQFLPWFVFPIIKRILSYHN